MNKNASRGPRMARSQWLLGFILVAATAAEAQLPYDHTTFINGFASDTMMWKVAYPDLGATTPTPPSYLDRNIQLRSIILANASKEETLAEQIQSVVQKVGSSEHHLLVAHSNGGLVARGLYIDNESRRANISGIITMGTPHQGTPLADNAVEARDYLLELQRRVNDAADAIGIAYMLDKLVGTMVAGDRSGPVYLVIALLMARDYDVPDQISIGELATLPDLKALPDVKPASATIAHLQLTPDAGIQRASVVAIMPKEHALLRLYASIQRRDAGLSEDIKQRNKAITAFRGCQHVAQYIAIAGDRARRCGRAARALESMDDKWGQFVKGSETYTFHFPIIGDYTVKVARNVPFDGIVPNENSNYPGLSDPTRKFITPGLNHQNIYGTRQGLDQVVLAMRAFGMVPRATLSTAIVGPSKLYDDGKSGTWTASVGGGVAPFRYKWSGMLSGTASSISGYAEGTLKLEVWDAQNAYGVATKSVSISAVNCPGTQRSC